jgi:hypothetical protein
VPWDVELARWFDDHFAPLERRRSYARASRRQAATPDIPRPGWYVPEELADSRTFGVDLLEHAADFPKNGPILVLTDAWIDRVRISRDHAFLIPAGATLPFPPRGPVFRFA